MKINISENSINIFLVRLSKLNDASLTIYKDAITDEELNRFNSYKSDKNKLVSIISRGLFRIQFSRLLNLPLSDIKYLKETKTKPKLLTKNIRKSKYFDFNISHVEDWVVLAISPFQIGVDVEYTLRKNNISGISNRFFSKFEIDKLNQLNDTEKNDLFFSYWTLKEAYLKANGLGISSGLNNFYFSLEDPSDIKMISSQNKIINNNWSFNCFSPENFYKISLAYEFNRSINMNIYELVSATDYLKLDCKI